MKNVSSVQRTDTSVIKRHKSDIALKISKRNNSNYDWWAAGVEEEEKNRKLIIKIVCAQANI